MEKFTVAVIGSGPAGLSAAARAAHHGMSHILLESKDHASDTIFKYQKGKYVMATPDILPLRSNMSFEAGIREDILGTWDRQLEEQKVNIRYKAEVTAISGAKGSFKITLANGEEMEAENVILGIGLQGNLRKMGVPGQEWDRVQYQLDDPEEYDGETIIVVGAGDAAIENAVALAKQNKVYIINRRDEFARAKTGNLNLITDAIDKGTVDCFYSSSPVKVEPGKMTLKTADGEAEIACDRIIARLGAIPPRKFVESCGIEFPSADPNAVPEVSSTYESNVDGLYIIGALGGYPLIKQAMNQGYEAVEFIRGNIVKPADEPLLEERLAGTAIANLGVEGFLTKIRENVPLFSDVNTLVMRELMLDSTVHTPKNGDVVFARNDYTNTFYSIVEGEVDIQIDPEDPSVVVTLGEGAFFGEMGLISGRRRTATVVAKNSAVLLETNRRSMIKLINSTDSVKRVMDQTALGRQLQTYIAQGVSNEELKPVVEKAEIKTYQSGDVLFEEGEEGDTVHLIRRGSVTVSRQIGGRDIVLSYVAAGNYVGEMALLQDAPRSATIRAAVNNTETVVLEGQTFKAMLANNPAVSQKIEEAMRARVIQNTQMEATPNAGSIVEFLVGQGLGEATDVLLIDESLCVRCDNCEKACSETHGGRSRLNREAGPTFDALHVPTSCRHCEHPHCMKDCPADAIHRAPDGEVFIDDKCIGCGNCSGNCPYGVIHMAPEKTPRRKSLLSWLLFGGGPEPGEDRSSYAKTDKKVAVKCDMCKDIKGGAACVRACPTGAALRVKPEQFFNITNLAK